MVPKLKPLMHPIVPKKFSLMRHTRERSFDFDNRAFEEYNAKISRVLELKFIRTIFKYDGRKNMYDVYARKMEGEMHNLESGFCSCYDRCRELGFDGPWRPYWHKLECSES